jgi:hypothetical protein
MTLKDDFQAFPDTSGTPAGHSMGPIETTQPHRLEPGNGSPIERTENTMNMKKIGIATLFAALSLGALSAQAQDSVSTHSYMYGEHLDIARALSTEVDATPTCGLVNTHLNYVDSHGQKQTLNYRTIAQDCAGDN